jgi:glucose/arabinose dehydrogenase
MGATRKPSFSEISCAQKREEMFHGPHFNVDMAQPLDLRRWFIMMAGVAVGLLLAFLLMMGPSRAAAPISFGKSTLHSETSTRPTSLQFGPDGRLYVAQQNGLIKIYTVKRSGANNYAVTATQTVRSIKTIPNHNDKGALNTGVTDRQLTGILVRGTKTNPVIYATSSDPRIGGVSQYGDNGDVNLDTNSGVLSRLRWTGSSWKKVDLVRGLPRSEENHSTNGLQLDPSTNTMYLAQGGNTNLGAPSYNFALLPEYALSAAILKVDLDAIGNTTYDLPTLNDEDRAGNPDTNDPFGGNDGKNQAKLVSGGPVQVYEPGFRNPYDLLIAKGGKMYTIDNSSNAGAGGVPVNCTNQRNEGGTTEDEALDLVGQGRYGGHANPTRGSELNTFNADNPQSPVTAANPIECDSLTPGVDNGSLTTFSSSTNGLTEYTASNFGGAMKGNLLAASFDDNIYRIKLNGSGNGVVFKQVLFTNVGNKSLDLTAQGDARRFPGTIWVANIGDGTTGSGSIKVFEPNG